MNPSNVFAIFLFDPCLTIFLSCFLSIFQVSQKGCGLSVLEDIQKPFNMVCKIISRQLCLSRALYQVIFRTPFQPQLFCILLVVNSVWSNNVYLYFYSLDISKPFFRLFPNRNLSVNMLLNLLYLFSIVYPVNIFWSCPGVSSSNHFSP